MIARVPNPEDLEININLIERAIRKAITAEIDDEKSGSSKWLKLTPYSFHEKIFAVFPLSLAFCIWLLNIVVIAMLGYSLLQNAVTAALIITSFSIGFILVFYSILLWRADAHAREAEMRARKVSADNVTTFSLGSGSG
jgi:hypothetical protein